MKSKRCAADRKCGRSIKGRWLKKIIGVCKLMNIRTVTYNSKRKRDGILSSRPGSV
jgi:hypothetical protein